MDAVIHLSHTILSLCAGILMERVIVRSHYVNYQSKYPLTHTANATKGVSVVSV